MADHLDGHTDHDPVRVAALVDHSGALASDDTVDDLARGWVEHCPECAAKFSDLIALSVATAALPAPPRPRDFQISVADAARLTEANAHHAAHDLTLVAALTDRSIDPADRAAGEAQVAACADCATVLDDLSVLAAAVALMPTPARPSDYQLSPEDAIRLRPRGWRRILSGLGSSRDLVTRPLAIGLTTLGLVGVLVAGAPSLLFLGSAASAPDPDAVGTALGAADAARNGTSPETSVTQPSDPGQAPIVQVQRDTAGEPGAVSGGAIASPAGLTSVSNPGTVSIPAPGTSRAAGLASKSAEPAAPNAEDANNPIQGVDPTTPGSAPPIILLSSAFLVAGLGLFLLRWSVRRSAVG